MAWGKWNEKVRWRGVTMDYCTKAFFVSLEKRTDMLPTYYQGSYSKSVEASGGTHDGGSIADIWVPAATREAAIDKNSIFLRAAKNLGGMGWRRFPPTFPDHLHLGPLAGPNPSSELILQWKDYKADGNGLYPYTGGDDNVNPYRADVKPWGKERYQEFKEAQALRTRIQKLDDSYDELMKKARHLFRKKRRARRQLKKLTNSRNH